jgi:hypothetical protein
LPKDDGLMLTRVTIPIAYRDPLIVREISKKREELMALGTPDCKIRKEIDRIVDDYKGTPSPYTIGFLGKSLLSHSAQKIYLIDMAGKLKDNMLTNLPDYLKPRIELIDNQKIFESVDNMLTPVWNDLDNLWKKVRAINGATNDDSNGHEHGYCLLGEFLTTLTVSTKYNTEADIDLDVVNQAIVRIKKQATSQESQIVIARIEGILNCYKLKRKIPSIKTAAQILPKDLLADLLDDSAIISLSKERYYFGVPSKAKIAMIRTRQKIREILTVPRNRKYLVMAGKFGNIATKQINVELPDFDAQNEPSFSPPFLPLDEMKPSCLRTNRKLSEIDPFKII